MAISMRYFLTLKQRHYKVLMRSHFVDFLESINTLLSVTPLTPA